MNVAILTLPLYANYGGILQAFALSRVIEGMGHKPIVLYTNQDIFPQPLRIPIMTAKRIVKKMLGHKCERVFEEYISAKERPVVRAEVNRFINQYIPLRVCKRLSDRCIADVNVVVVGSDQVWRKPYFEHNWRTGIKNAFGAFVPENIKLMAYAASFGTDDWEYTYEDTKLCALQAKRFVALSSREESGVRLLNDKLGVVAECVLDPTMLLTRDDYNILIEASETEVPNGDVFNYILDSSPEKQRIIDNICERVGGKAYGIRLSSADYHLPVSERKLPSVEQWLRSIRDAKVVVTDSFHACVFSIIFGKPFIVTGNQYRGNSRFETLLNRFGLMSQMVADINGEVSLDIDYDKVYERLEIQRSDSRFFLSALNSI